MRKLKLFVDNLFVYGIGGVISRVIPLVMIPVVTHLMPDQTYYGLSDLSSTLVQIGSALAIMGMYDAMYRLFFDKDETEYKKRVCSTALVFTFAASIVVFMFMVFLRKHIAGLFFDNYKYTYLVYLSAIATLFGATNGILSAPTRMQNKRKVYLLTNTILPLLSYSIAIPLIISGHYVIALPLAAVISGIAMNTIFIALNHKWFNFNKYDAKILRQLLVIALPLVPNIMIYWIFNSSDRIMVTKLIGVGAAGIYAVGSKMGHISQLIYTAFAGGWQYFAFSTMKDEGQVKTNSLIFEYLGVLTFIASAYMCTISYPLFTNLFSGEYLLGYVIAPYLFVAPLLQMLFQVIGNQFLVIKKTWPSMIILFGGAAINVILNFALIPRLGIEGAAIATLVGYTISVLIMVIVLHHMKLLVISNRFVISVFIFTLYFILWRLFLRENTFLGVLLSMLITTINVILYRKDIQKFTHTIKGRNKPS